MAGNVNQYTFFAVDFVGDLISFLTESVAKLFETVGMWPVYLAAVAALTAFLYLVTPLLPKYFGQAIARFNDFTDYQDAGYDTIIDVDPSTMNDPSHQLESGD